MYFFEAQFDDSEDIVIGEAYDLLATDGKQFLLDNLRWKLTVMRLQMMAM